ncbi:MAG TPA: acetyl-CoA carboxylase biotin carboxyl carrier protein [Pyrinomonadaceae bacterium]|jgi:acetyl-CoA carboxylase biotin carboxyl carrier protein
MSAPKEQSETPNRRARTAPKPAASVNMEELRELIALLRDNGLAELELENEGFRVRLRRDSAAGSSYVADAPQPAPAPAAASVPAPPPASGPTHPGTHASTEASQDQDLHIIPSPIVGTFYRSPSPAADPFVKIGSNVEPESVVCIIEAMKLMNEIQAETSGEVVKIYVENGQPVEYGQPLFGIKPQ